MYITFPIFVSHYNCKSQQGGWRLSVLKFLFEHENENREKENVIHLVSDAVWRPTHSARWSRWNNKREQREERPRKKCQQAWRFYWLSIAPPPFLLLPTVGLRTTATSWRKIGFQISTRSLRFLKFLFSWKMIRKKIDDTKISVGWSAKIYLRYVGVICWLRNPSDRHPKAVGANRPRNSEKYRITFVIGGENICTNVKCTFE